MEHIRFVQVLYGAKKVVDDRLDVENVERDILFDQLLQVALGVLHHDVEGVEVLGVRRIEDFDEFNHEWMLQFAH